MWYCVLLVAGLVLSACVFPGSKVKRPSRRKLGRGQAVQLPAATFTITAATAVVTIASDVPITVNGTIPLAVEGLTLVSQTIVDQQTVHQTWSDDCSGLDYTLAGGLAMVRTYQGGSTNPASGTFAGG